jgi:hypothetical protein
VLFSRRGAENAGVSIITCRSDFSREHRLKFATKVAPTNTCKNSCVLCAPSMNSAQVLRELNMFSLFDMLSFECAE